MTDYKTLRSLAERATRPWTSDVWIETDGNEWRATGPGHEEHVDDYGSEPGSPDEQAAQRDAEYIAAASPDVVLALLDEVERLRREVDRQTLRADTNWDGQQDAERELSAMTAARDEACSLIQKLVDAQARYSPAAVATSPEFAAMKREIDRRIDQLRKVGGTP